ncbi:MAG: hypothetical protein OK454_10960, partial [Thaumarchaeota archaeon]|nr:hypothetical protein [Nitrososphaerota archaeon]
MICILGRELGEGIDVTTSVPLLAARNDTGRGSRDSARPEVILDCLETIVHHRHLQSHPCTEMESRVVIAESDLAVCQIGDILLLRSNEITTRVARTRRETIGHKE